MKVSVIVPVYNVYKYLEKCLESLVNQTLKDIEIIVVNDGSPDNSDEIAKKYAKKYKNVKYFEKENGGQGSARNLALKHAKGKYIGYIDSDDYVDLDMYEKMYQKAIENDSDIVVCDMMMHEGEETKYFDCTHFDSAFTSTPSACNKLFKKDVIKGIEFLERTWYEDFNYTTKILLKTNKIDVIHEPFYHYIVHESSTMNNNNSKKNLDIIKVVDDIIDYSIKNDCYDYELTNYLVYNYVLVDAVNRVALHKNKEKKETIKELIEYSRKRIPNYKKCEFYKKEPLKRKLIANLNFNHLSGLASFIFKIKKVIK